MAAQKMIELSPDLHLDAAKFPILKTAILGLPDSGKSYTAMKLAEELLELQVPIVVLDPVGIWHSLKIGRPAKKGKAHPGYKVVIAGGEHADIPLTVKTAPEIMKACMKANIPVVFDLYSVEMSEKATWIKVLEAILKVLIYENKPYGQRHIFIEEAGEFAPQTMKPQHFTVFSHIEKLTRMGRNMNLGATFINQRAEDLNKSILENCNITMLHNQTGRNSLKNIEHWLSINRIEDSKAEEIMTSLPRLGQGHCWVLQKQEIPKLIKVAERRTLHPNPEDPVIGTRTDKVQDVSSFVELLNKSLTAGKPPLPGKSPQTALKQATTGAEMAIIAELRSEVAAQKKVISQYEAEKQKMLATGANLISQVDSLRKMLDGLISGPKVNGELKAAAPPRLLPEKSVAAAKPVVSRHVTSKPGSAISRMLDAAKLYYPGSISRSRMAILSQMSASSGSFRTHIATLKREGLMVGAGDQFTLTADGAAQAGDMTIPTDPDELIEFWANILGSGGGAARIFRQVCKAYPNPIDRDTLADQAGMTSSSGSFRTYLATLKRNGLIEYHGATVCATKEIFES